MDLNTTAQYPEVGFDNDIYIRKQSAEIKSRLDRFSDGRLYLEIGGKFISDPHGERVLPGFNPRVKADIIQKLGVSFDILFCISALDIEEEKKVKNSEKNYVEYSVDMVRGLQNMFKIKPKIVINRISDRKSSKLISARRVFTRAGYEVFNRYSIDGYPDSKELIFSKEGFGKDDYIPLRSDLVLITGIGIGSGKLSTCIGMMYHDKEHGLESGYAKFETFPVWNLPLNHPVNLAYEAATVDTGNHNVIDIYHLNAYHKESINYNQDINTFVILKTLSKYFVGINNFIHQYRSPTDMGVNMVGFGITNDCTVSIASYNEICRRITEYEEKLSTGKGKKTWVKKCQELKDDCRKYLVENGYDPMVGE
jgi:uncharacterized protein (UPF0371 family)